MNRITRRTVGKLLVATGLSAGAARAITPSAGSLRPDRASIEWQDCPQVLDQTRPRFHWTLAAVDPKARNLRQTAHRTRILSAIDRHVVFDSDWVSESKQSFQPKGAIAFDSQTSYVWQLQVRGQDGVAAPVIERQFATGLIAPSRHTARWIAFEPDANDRLHAIERQTTTKEKPDPLPIFRKAFTAGTRPAFAHLTVAGLGQYHLWLNGKQVSRHGLNGGWTDYNRRVQYDGYDVTKLIKSGEQTIGVTLGNGFFNVEEIKDRYTKLEGRFGQPQMWLQLKLHFRDGRQETIVSDGTWQTRIGGTGYSSIYGGEDFDARRDDGHFGAHPEWKAALVVTGPQGTLEAANFAPAVEAKAYAVKKAMTPKAGIMVYDFGTNHAGRPRIVLKNMVPGTVIRMYPAELLGDDGTADQVSMTGGSKSGLRGIAFNYTCRGGKSETWQPQFTYTGYRYLQVEGVDKAHVTSIESLAVHADLDKAGTFACSDTNMEAIHGLIRQALLSNTMSVLTDCPTREKLGWLEQIYLNAATAMNNLDAVRLYEKMARDICDAQEASGMIPAISPEFVKFVDRDGKSTKFRDTPEWSASIVLAPWYVYQRYGDTAILSQSYTAMTAHMAYLETRAGDDGLIDFGLGDWYDIGPKHPGEAQLTSRKMTGTATWYAQLVILQKIAQRLGKPGADAFATRAAALKATLQAQLFNAEKSTFDTGSQTAQAMALVLDLFPADSRQKALEVLVADFRAHDTHVTSGDIGFHYVVRALSDVGRADVLYDLLSKTDKPSYLQQIKNGATSLTEAWDGWRESSQNHFMLGHAEIWFFQGLGGVTMDFAGDVPIILAPQVVAGIDRCAIDSRTVVGRVACAVARQGDSRVVDVVVPAGQLARLRLPYATNAQILESGAAFTDAKGILSHIQIDGATWVTLGSGSYSFTGPTF